MSEVDTKKELNKELNKDIVFQTLSWHYQDVATVSETEEDFQTLEFQLFAFGRTRQLGSSTGSSAGSSAAGESSERIGFANGTKSVCLQILNFNLFYYILVPDDFGFETAKRVFNYLKGKIESNIEYNFREKGDYKRISGLIDHKLIKKKKLFGYTAGREYRYIKLVFSNLKDYNLTKYNIKKGIRVNGKTYNFDIYESKVDPVVKFYHNRKIQSTGYCLVKDYFICDKYEKAYISTDIAIKCDYRKIEYYNYTGEAVMPLRVLSFDIETQSHDKESFPNPLIDGDYIGVIGISVWTYGSSLDYERHVITKSPCSRIQYVTVHQTDSEKELLKKFCDLVQKLDPDIIAGFNTWRFDEKYISIRMDKFGLGPYKNKLSRHTKFDTTIVQRKLHSSAYGTNDFEMFDYKGRDTLDVLFAIKKEHKLERYGLNDVSRHFLRKEKHDLHPHTLFQYLEQGPDKIALVSSYCIQDTVLVLDNMKFLCIVPNMMEMSATTYVPNNWLLYKGQQCKAYSLICKEAKENDFLIPDVVFKDNQNFAGAKVLEARRRAYYKQVTGLDFSSLYPSIMIAHNMCYTTLVLEEKYMNLPGVCYETIEWKDQDSGQEFKYTFVQDPENSFEKAPENSNETPSIFDRGPKIDPKTLDPKKCYRGLLPTILTNLKVGRSNTKKKMAALVAKDPANKQSDAYYVLDGKQLAQKVTMNSVYGFTGTGENGMLPCKAISASVTARGRDMIIETKNMAEELYSCTALYGDSIPGSEYVYFNANNANSSFSPIKDNANNANSSFSPINAFNDTVGLMSKIKVSEVLEYIDGGVSWEQWIDDKEQLNLEKFDYMTLSGSGPSKIQRVIRHKTQKKLYKISAQDSSGFSRSVIVTEGHSLVAHDGKLIEADKLKVGALLKNI
jgi:DNA polymerase delta subunit 1